ncbi:uncharacterized protein SCHCODRAFT_02491270 [Schizophyllum commune H4-8]|uniref:uncharacterized protein n=1 Tax=Schizophyllum commune (strain H4-8 / FGSC 9210) TaxID=578458 RepID=UPI00215EFEED|nr:uncharacterized protein SCHCODRAFT_02491270 [Schizophyllum commune H4-8]KAI5897204.1 hypothetical protein SCHCODRAFT_02491270 [Schizophyllum commune H4-8]
MSSTDNYYAFVSLASLRNPFRRDLATERGEALTRTLTHLRGTEAVLSATISSLQADRDAVAFELAKILALRAPVRRLPVELLCMIFEMVAGLCRDAVEIGREVAALRSVSAFWADVADMTPRLWTRAFTVPWRSCQSHLELNARLSRALPMSVEHTVADADDVAASALHHLLGSEARWSTVAFRASWGCFTANAHPHHYALLTAAKLWLEGDADPGALRWLQHAVGLDSLTLVCDDSRMSGSFVVDVPVWPRLTSLTLGGLRDGTVRFITSLIRQCASVEYLRVDSLVDSVDNDIDVDDVAIISMPELCTLRLDNHTSFVLVVICAPRLRQLTLNDFDDYRLGIDDLLTLLSRSEAQPRLEELRIARVDSGLPDTSGTLMQCLGSLQWLRVLDIDDCSAYTQSFGSELLFDSLTFRYGSPVLLPSLVIFDYRPSPGGMSVETADALQSTLARASRTLDELVLWAMHVRGQVDVHFLERVEEVDGPIEFRANAVLDGVEDLVGAGTQEGRVTVRSKEDASRLRDQRDIHSFAKELRMFSCLSLLRTPVLVNVDTVRLRLGTTSESRTDTRVLWFLSRFPRLRNLSISAGFTTVEALDVTLRGVASALPSFLLQLVVKAPKGPTLMHCAEFPRLRFQFRPFFMLPFRSAVSYAST